MCFFEKINRNPLKCYNFTIAYKDLDVYNEADFVAILILTSQKYQN
jgi:hypothetical protein